MLMLMKIADLGSSGVSSRRWSPKALFAFFALPLFVVAVGGSALFHFGTKTPATIEVQEKEAVGGEDGKYLVYTKGEVFENGDSFWALKWNSSDVYRQIEPGNCYHTTAWGVRVPFLSMYRNIDQVEATSCS